MTQPLTIALSKGRILEATLPLLAAAGIEPEVDPDKSRKLVFETTASHLDVMAKVFLKSVLPHKFLTLESFFVSCF